MELPNERIKSLMAAVFDRAYFASPDVKDSIIAEALDGFIEKETNAAKVYTVAELQAMPVGTMFEHSVRGRCWVVAKTDGTKCVRFQSGGTINLLLNGDPWNKPMRVLYTPKG